MVEMIEKVNNAINGFVWGPIMLILLVIVMLAGGNDRY